ncbi:MAG: peptidoglycan-binding protein [Devosiaceae bacterium]|nr:peptidoglycan-binding protein [Devosiaceae bacterium MH13]
MRNRIDRREPALDGYDDAAIPSEYDERGQGWAHATAWQEDDEWDEYDEPTLMDRLSAAPGKAAVAVLAFAAFGLVSVNAALFQPGAHPAPMMATRAAAPADPLPQQTRLAANPESDRSVGVVREDRLIAAPAPSVPPYQQGEATASIPASGAASHATLARTPWPAPAPVPRPSTFSVRRPDAVPPAPQMVATSPVAPQVVTTVPVNDPIAALLQPSQPGAPAAVQTSPQTRSAQPMVAAVQAVLAQLGYAPGTIDGVMGPGTEEAIRRFQLRRALEPNGQISAELIREIERVTGQRMSAS